LFSSEVDWSLAFYSRNKCSSLGTPVALTRNLNTHPINQTNKENN
jgi:hypothetical protein